MTWRYLSRPRRGGAPRRGGRSLRWLGRLALGSGYLLGGRLAAQRPATAPTLAFRNVTVIDVTNGRQLTDQTVLVVGNRIKAVGPAKSTAVPAGAQVVDARGKYLIPGLWDMHVHASVEGGGEVEDAGTFRPIYSLFIANGVTGIREMAQRWEGGSDSFRVWQREIMAGTRIGPRGVGPSADLSENNGIEIVAPENAAPIVDSLKAAGDAFAKFHGSPDDREIFFAIMREARKVGLPVVGHVPPSVTNVEAADSGMRSIEHNQVHHQCWAWPKILTDSAALDEACAPVAQAYIRNGTWLVPTMGTHWLDPTPGHRSPELWASTLRFWRTLHRMGVKNFLAGTDWIDGIMNQFGREFWPGLSARDEVVFLADAGLTPLEALQAATLNPAVFLNATDSLGTVEAGKLADLVLLDADPLADIANVLKLWGVVANGRYFDRAVLDAMDPEGAKPGNGLVAWDRRLQREAAQGQAPAGAANAPANGDDAGADGKSR